MYPAAYKAHGSKNSRSVLDLLRNAVVAELPVGELEMNEPLTFSVACPTTGLPVELETRNWFVAMDDENEVIHYRAECACGIEHLGCMTKRFAQVHSSN